MIRQNIDNSPWLNDCVKRFITRGTIPFTAVEHPDTSRRGKIICSDAPIEALLYDLRKKGIYKEKNVKLRFVGEYYAEGVQRKFACMYLEARDGRTVIRLGTSAAGDFQQDQLKMMDSVLANLHFSPHP